MSDSMLMPADDGRTVEVKPGDKILIRLEENPTTGYRWTVARTDEQILELLSSDYAPALGGGIGGGGERTMVFRAKKTGTTPLQLKCLQEWERESPLHRFSITVTVRD